MKRQRFPRSLFTVRCGLLAAFVVMHLVASAQQPQSQTTQSPPPVLRVTTRLVQVSVIVRDGKGQHIPGLTKDDFALTEQGQAQKISLFSEQVVAPISEAPLRMITPTGAVIFSNRFEEAPGLPVGATVILIDALNTPISDFAYARAEIINFLHKLQPQDRVALYGLASRLFVLHDFTNDARSLLQTLGHAKANPSDYRSGAEDLQASDTGNDNLDAFIAAAEQRAADINTINRAQETAVAMASIAGHLAELPGRKNLVWVSASFPFQIGTGTAADDPGPGNPAGGPGGSMPGPSSNQRYQTFEKEIESASQALTSADVAIYPVDARGIVGFRNLSPSVRALPRTQTKSRVPAASAPPLGMPSRLNTDAMEVMANRTGGKAFFNTNDIGGAIRHAIDDANATYVLGYYPTNSRWDGRFREITVDVKRPGAHLRYRKGYFAYAEPAVDIQRQKERMEQVIASPLQDAEWKLRVAVTPKTEPAGRRIAADVEIDASRLSFRMDGENRVADVQIAWTQYSVGGRAAGGFTETLNLVFSPQAYEASLRDGLKLSREVAINDGAVLVRFVACDLGSGAIGSVDIPLQKVFPHEGSPATPDDH
jgi:VWFA-related protein